MSDNNRNFVLENGNGSIIARGVTYREIASCLKNCSASDGPFTFIEVGARRFTMSKTAMLNHLHVLHFLVLYRPFIIATSNDDSFQIRLPQFLPRARKVFEYLYGACCYLGLDVRPDLGEMTLTLRNASAKPPKD